MKDLVLGIESSCDDTCACLMSLIDGRIEYNRSIHQDEVHANYGGIVPNLASAEHLKHIELIKKDLVGQSLMRVACIASTTGPGLIGSLLVGTSFAKGLAMSLGVPLLRVNHLEGHALSCMIENDVNFPFLLLLVSGGNSQIILAKGLGEYRIIGQTLDDAAGEALDKIAKYLGIDYPGGINLEKWAEKSVRNAENTNECIFHFKNGCINNNTFNFSFSGLKTQVMYKVKELGGIEIITDDIRAELAFSAQEAVFETLLKKVRQVISKDVEIKKMVETGKLKEFVVCGGVSANKRLSMLMKSFAEEQQLSYVVPSMPFTTDNAGMIAKVGCLYWQHWRKNKQPLGFGLDYNTMDISFSPVAKWSIDKLPKMIT